MNLLQEFGRLLAELGLGDYQDGPGGDIYLRASPPEPDTCLVVTRYPGAEASSAQPYERVNLQIMIRGPADEENATEDRAQAVYDTLHGLDYRPLAGGTFLELAIGLQGGPIPMPADANRRPRWTVNVGLDIQRSTPNRP
ncbi:minor capsid protein [Nonomuraea sp. NPDC050310]|uniref:minor capsid protein n=1 Tax=Nonomuraea sp. NPDC050310 TaxID=3154935 RepID=UPI0033D21561